MKLSKHILLMAAMLLSCLLVDAHDFEVDGIYYNVTSEEELTVEVTFCGSQYNEYDNEYSGIVTIRDFVSYNNKTYRITSIGDRAFYNCKSITSVSIPEGVAEIGNYAFYRCYGLTSISLPEGVTSIGDFAFHSCTSLAYIAIPESLTKIGRNAFEFCGELTSIFIPEGVEEIPFSCFAYCRKLKDLTIPQSVKVVKQAAFLETAWYNDQPNGVVYINDILYQYKGEMPENSSIEVKEGTKSITPAAFENCLGLTSVTILDGVIEIGYEAFRDCSNLESVVLPKSLKKIDMDVFSGCINLKELYCNSEDVPSTSLDAFDGSGIKNATLYVPSALLSNYRSVAPWKNFGKKMAIKVIVEEINLNESSVTLMENESRNLVANISPSSATDKTVIWSSSNEGIATVSSEGVVTAIAPGTAIITVTANDGSGVSALCEVTVKKLILGKCATPMVSYTEGKVELTCPTEEVEYVTSVVPDNELNYQSQEFDFIPTYTFSIYATKAKYEDSDVACVTICWIDCTEEHGDSDGIIAIPSRPVLIQTNNGVITLTGLEEGTAVVVYDLGGTQQGTATAANGTATITTSLTAGNTAIVKIGERSVKVVVK